MEPLALIARVCLLAVTDPIPKFKFGMSKTGSASEPLRGTKNLLQL